MTNALERTRALEGRSLQGVAVLHSENWLEIELECVGTEIKAKAQGPGDTRASYHSFGPALDVESLRQFSQEVEKAATQARSLALPTLKRAQTIHQALFQGTLNKLLERQRGAAGNEKLLLRLMLPPEGSLQEFPWEALCAPDTLFGFLGNSTDVLLARGVDSMERLVPREVREKVRVLAIAPTQEEALLRCGAPWRSASLRGRSSGSSPWWGGRLGRAYLHDRLMLEPIPHILHFLGHGSVDEKGMPRLRLADEEDRTENWISVEVLAKQLGSFRKCLRLIVLEACRAQARGHRQCGGVAHPVRGRCGHRPPLAGQDRHGGSLLADILPGAHGDGRATGGRGV